MMGIRELAEELERRLIPFSDVRIIAGSLRRYTENPKDIDLVVVPRFVTLDADLFGQVQQITNTVEQNMDAILREDWQFDLRLKRNGERSKRLAHIETGVCCDMSITTRKQFGVMLTIRTGPGDFGHDLVVIARLRGYHVHDGVIHKHPVIVTYSGPNNETREEEKCALGMDCPNIFDTPNEQAVFDALEVPFFTPATRKPDSLTGFVDALKRARKK